MNSYNIIYYFEHGYLVSQVVESDSRENVLKSLVEEGVIDFMDENNIYHRFNMKDVKLINVIVIKPQISDMSDKF
jgi:hypothetical protein